MVSYKISDATRGQFIASFEARNRKSAVKLFNKIKFNISVSLIQVTETGYSDVHLEIVASNFQLMEES